MEIKYMEWNLNARGGIGYKIPEFIPNYLKDKDVFVLVEFSMGQGWDQFKKELSEFDLYCSPYGQEYNQICIGIRKELGYELKSLITQNVCNINIPEFLQVDIEINNKAVSIIGVRIKTEANKKNEQYKWLKDYLKNQKKNQKKFLCLGDYNCSIGHLREIYYPEFNPYGPRTSKGYFSYVFRNRGVLGLDWLLESGIDKVYNGYSDSNLSPYATYDFSFVNRDNGYEDKTKDDYLTFKNLPDHAILKGMIKI